MQATLITDVQGPRLNADEKQWLTHRFLGGVILFSRHFESREQLIQLIHDIKTLNPALLITVDHEGGRVQRFRQGFTQVPAMGRIGQLYSQAPDQAVALAKAAAIVLAYELQEVGIDLTYAPVLDMDYERNTVIGDRSFGLEANTIHTLAAAFMSGLNTLNFAVVAKHFPGHGWVNLDSHVACPVDERSLADIQSQDLQPFKQLLPMIDWMMPAHVVYPQVDSEPAGFSRVWLNDILKREMGFTGRIVSDDLSMAGAAVKGDYQQRALAAINAGCDILLACNHAHASTEILKALDALSAQDQTLTPCDLTDYKPHNVLTDHTSTYMNALALLAQFDAEHSR